MKNMAVILAAGVGSRLLPITNLMPKSLVKVGTRPILDYQIKGYINSGIKEDDIIIVTGYMSEEIENYLKANYPKVQIVESKNYKSTNNMYSLYMALNSIREQNNFNIKTLFINNADCLYDENLMKEFVNCKFDNTIASEVGVYIEESMKLKLDKDSHIIDIAKTIQPEDAAGVSVDLYKFNQSAVLELYAIIKDFIEVKKDLKQWTEVAFPPLFKKVSVYPFDIKHKKWVEVDNNDDLLMADKLFSDFDFKAKKAYICDLDGTLFIGNTPIEPAINFVKKYKNNFDFYFLTNNTSRTPDDYVKKLLLSGIDATADQIATPLFTLIDYIKKEAYKSVYLIANQKVKDFVSLHLPNVSLEFDIKQNQALILTYDTEINYEKLKNAAILLNNKSEIKYIVTHTDVFCPNEQGPIPDIGSFINLIKATNGFEPQIVLGKPSVHLIQKYVDKYGKDNIVVIGDRLYTDKKLADNVGCDFICVLSGETKRVDVANLKSSIMPAIILNNLGCLD